LLLVASALLLPAVAHLMEIPVRILLPMHWPVILAGLCYGWRSGLLVGLASPAVSYLLSGMPPPAILAAMTLELAAYGFLAGFFCETVRLGRWPATALALIGGRLLFVAAATASGAIAGPILEYLKAALVPGLPAALAQLLLLPPIAGWWVGREQRRQGMHAGQAAEI
jgi:niacin transporter